MWVIFEGISGTGKSFQVHQLRARLQRGLQVASVGEFSSGSLGRLIDQTYRERRVRFVQFHGESAFGDQSHLVLLADAVAKAEEASRSSADVFLIDRLFDSWLCYTLASPDRGALDDDLLDDLHHNFVQRYVPPTAVTVFLQLDVEIAMVRLAGREDFGCGQEERGRLEAAARGFENLYRRVPVIRVNAGREPARVTTEILAALKLDEW